MSITVRCECGKILKAREEYAGKKAKCPQCGAVCTIAPPEAVSGPSALDGDDGGTYGLQDPDPMPVPSRSFSEDVEEAPSRPRRTTARATAASARDEVEDETAEGSSLLEYAYLLLIFALIPLAISLLGKDETLDFGERLAKTIKQASPKDQERIRHVLSSGEISDEEALAVMPGHKLFGAHLARDTSVHWLYAAIAATGFLLLLGLFFSVERARAAHLFGVGLFTGTVGIIFLFAVQLCSGFRFGRIRGRGLVILIMLLLMFIGWSYDSANDPDSSFFLSALGFTFGVGLCEEFTKAIPLLIHYRTDSEMGWRSACLWGLASGIGFGVSEGIMYSARHYNGLSGVDIYLVRFISCVALHAMWSASVGIAIARNVDEYDKLDGPSDSAFFILRVMAMPMLLHGFYDTLLKKDMNGWALLVALLSFGWLAWHIELARKSYPEAGRVQLAR